MTPGAGYDAAVALAGGLVKAAVRPAALDAVVDVVVEALQGVDDLVRGAAADGWDDADDAALAATLEGPFDAIPGVDAKRAKALAGGLAALVGLIVDAGHARRKAPSGPVGKFFARRTGRL